MIEYPKMLVREDAHVIVDNEQAEQEARAEGWHMYGEEPTQQGEGEEAAKPARRGRPPRAAE